MTVAACDLRLAPRGSVLSASADLVLSNRTAVPVATVLLSLNPGLKVGRVWGPAGPLRFEQKDHLVSVHPGAPVEAGQDIRLSLDYSGTIDERYCYLDIGDDRYLSPLRFWVVSVPKRYVVVERDFLHLTPECGWYPRAGLPPALLFPKSIQKDFARYSLSITLPAGLTAVSQGPAAVTGSGPESTFLFKPDVLLPQISVTAGRFEKKSIVVDGTEYSLFTLPGHDRATPLLPELKGDLGSLIKQVRTSYEAQLGLAYPYQRFALVEVPVQIASYNRLWNTAQEHVQPEIIYLPEMGALCTGADFRSAQRTMLGPGMGGGRAAAAGAPGGAPAGQRAGGAAAGQRGGGGGRGQAASITPKDLQRALVTRFINANLTESVPAANARFRAGLFGIQFETNSETRFGIFPEFVSHAVHVDAPDWPLFDYVLESYLRGRVTAQAGPGLRLAQATTVQEEISKILAERSLAELLKEGERRALPLASILEAKSKQLLAVVQAGLAAKDFDAKLTEWLKGLRFQSVPGSAVAGFFRGLGELDLSGLYARWSGEKGVPGFVFDKLESYRVVEKERQRAQLKFEVANPTDTPGVIKVEFVTRGAMGGRMGGGGQITFTFAGGGAGGNVMFVAAGGAAERRYYYVPARTTKTIGLVLDQPAVATTIDTYISRNLPASFLLPFLTTQTAPGVPAFDGEVDRPYGPADAGAGGEYIVDDEDPGFRTPAGERENWLRTFIRKTFPADVGAEGEYAQFRGILDPPGQWTPIILQNFYGRFVRSAFFKRSGNGQSRVTWTADLKESGEYDISFYHASLVGGGAMMGPGGVRGGEMGGRGGFAGRGGAGGGMGQRGQPGGQRGGQGQPPAGAGLPVRLQPGKKHFIIHHEDGTEEVVIDLKDAQQEWNLIGTFRLAKGSNTVELTDRNDSIYVLADAVKWTRHKE
jgi:hypothetical protein